MIKKIFLLAIITLLFCINTMYSGPDSNRQKKAKAKALVKSGVELIEKIGPEKAFKAFTDKDGEYVEGEYYIFVVTFEGVTLAHGGNPALVGKNLTPLQDPDGVFFIQDLIKMAKENGSGWVNYKWSNPETKKIEKKTSYVEAIEGTDYFLGCGIYIK